VGILGTLLGRREPVAEYRTIDGGHPAPFPDMTDEQLYNYEVTFNVPHRTFDKPPHSAAPPEDKPVRKEPPPRKEPRTARHTHTVEEPQQTELQQTQDRQAPPRESATETPERTAQRPAPPFEQPDLPPLDLSKPVRLITTKQPVEIITTRARHPVYKVHAYIGDDDVVTVFTLDGRLSENGPRFLENVPQRQHLFLNIYANREARATEKYLITQHDTKQQADAAARPGRLACVPLEFDL